MRIGRLIRQARFLRHTPTGNAVSRTEQHGGTGRAAVCFSSDSNSGQSVSEEIISSIENEATIQELLAEKIAPYYQQQTPVVLRGAVANAKAVSEWKSWEYLRRTVSDDATCHVELGGNYSASSSERSDIRFQDFLYYMQLFEEQHGRRAQEGVSPPASDELVYLAQNDVIQELYQDFDVPQFCGDENNSVGHEGRLYSTMLWIGQYGCVSPMHNDPLDNVLMQFVGAKQAWLFPPEAGLSLYAGHEGNQPNTSPINPEEPPDFERYPLFAEASSPLQCDLQPGDLLYIPKRWFHYVRTVETSISVNAWWR
jgi:hypothetical protein